MKYWGFDLDNNLKVNKNFSTIIRWCHLGGGIQMIKTLVVFTTLLLSTLTYANNAALGDDYYEFASVSVTPIESSEIPYYNPFPTAQATADLGKVIAVIDQLIAVGKKVWPIIKDGVPVYTTDLNQGLSVLPRSNMAPQEILNELSNWSTPATAQFKITYKNKLGMEIVSFVYNIYFQYNGSLNGTGKYLTNITTQANHISAAWGFDVNAKSELVGIANVGTAKNPVASAIIKVSTKASSVLSSVENSWGYYIDGKGNFKELQ